jgi:hypothetical protein
MFLRLLLSDVFYSSGTGSSVSRGPTVRVKQKGKDILPAPTLANRFCKPGQTALIIIVSSSTKQTPLTQTSKDTNQPEEGRVLL